MLHLLPSHSEKPFPALAVLLVFRNAVTLLAVLLLLLFPRLAAEAQAPSYVIAGLGNLSTSHDGDSFSDAVAINDAGQVAGVYLAHNSAGEVKGQRAFLYLHGVVTDLGVPGVNIKCLPAVLLNRAGQVVVDNDSHEGSKKLAGAENIRTTEAFLYSSAGYVGLGTLATGTSEQGDSAARGVNDAGEVVGQSTVYDTPTHYTLRGAFLYSHGVMTSLCGPAGPHNRDSTAVAINNAGQVAGWSDSSDTLGVSSTRAAFLYSGGAMISLGSLGTDPDGHGSSQAVALNRSGQVTGTSEVYVGGKAKGCGAFLYSSGQMLNLGNFGVDKSGVGESIPCAINDAGQVIGSSAVYAADGTPKGHAAFLYSQGHLLNLGSLGVDKSGAFYSVPLVLNNAGQVLGVSDAYDAAGGILGRRPFLYTGGRLYDLTTLITNKVGWVGFTVSDINDMGQICGRGSHQSPGSNICREEGFVLTLVPPGESR